MAGRRQWAGSVGGHQAVEAARRIVVEQVEGAVMALAHVAHPADMTVEDHLQMSQLAVRHGQAYQPLAAQTAGQQVALPVGEGVGGDLGEAGGARVPSKT